MILKELLNKRNELVTMRDEIMKTIADAPDGNLRIAKNGEIVQYYHVAEKGDSQGKYLHKDQREYVCKLAQNNYDRKILREVCKEIKAIDAFLKAYNPEKLGLLYDKMNDMRKELVQPLYLSDEEYLRRWQEASYKSNPFMQEERVYVTKRGDLVRTKSEEMIADLYFEMGIPYKYECPVVLYNGVVKYPDFTLLKIDERKIIYHEHLGLLEDAEYRRANLIKINEYGKSGIVIGNNFLITFETSYCPFNLNTIRKTIQKVFR